MERLGEEALNLTGAGHGELVFRRQFIHTENGDDVAQFLVLLKRFLNTAGRVVVFFTDDVGVNLTAGGIERIHSGVNTQSSNITAQNDGGVQVAERGGRRRVSQVVSRHVHGLNRRNGTGLRGSNTFL